MTSKVLILGHKAGKDFFYKKFMSTKGTELSVCEDIERRQQIGLKKYGTSVQDNPMPLKAWLQHAYEEALDQAIYLKRAIEEIEKAEGK